ncbi:MAG: hypothetical protein HYS53_00600 [Candidatus Aenigmarchaeota archaeon]|nr:hypothetical protein [Candidatus Aenigmarchaeota archaeon]
MMPISDEMRKAAKRKPPGAENTTAGVPAAGYDGLYRETAEDLGNFAGELLGTENAAVKLAAPTVLILEPSKTHNGEICLNVGVSKISKPVFQRLLRVVNPYLLETDVVQAIDETEITAPMMEELVPGVGYLALMEKSPIGLAAGGGKCRQDAVHPFVFAYACIPDERPLIAAAISRGIKNGRVSVKTDVYMHRARDTVISAAPSLDYVSKIAEYYKIKNLKGAIAEINRVVGWFSQGWRE